MTCQLFFIATIILCLDAASGIGVQNIPCATATIRRRKPSFRHVSNFMPMLGFTVSSLEKDEEASEYKLWVDDENEESTEDEGDEGDELFLNDECMENSSSSKQERKQNFFRRRSKVDNDDNTIQHREIESENEEHPMRTDEWLIKVKLSPFLMPGTIKREASLFPQLQKSHTPENRKIEQVMKFAKNGYVILIEEWGEEIQDQNDYKHMRNSEKSKQRISKVGKWQMNTNGVSWSIPAHLSNKYLKPHERCINSLRIENEDTETFEDLDCSLDGSQKESSKITMLYYHADIHLSKFQSKPRMIRGTVVRDRYKHKFPNKQRMLRPVIATFTAEGIGEDTLMLQYSERGFGLSNNK